MLKYTHSKQHLLTKAGVPYNPSVFPPCFERRVDFVYPDADKDGTADTTESSVAYLYASGRLSGINTATTAYTITYDTFGNMVSVSAGGNVLATYTRCGLSSRRAIARYSFVFWA